MCYNDDMTEQALHTIQQHSMLRPGDHVVVGLSGGADSVALVHVLCSLREAWQLTLTAAHVNHNLRGEQSQADEQFCRNLCAQWQVPLRVHQAQFERFTEAAGREARYAFFSQLGGDKLALAHTLSDRMETFLLNIARGTTLRGLCSIPPVREKIIRPLIDCTRAQVEEYCVAHDLEYRMDESNDDLRYRRNHVRHEILPQLGWSPDHMRRMFAALEQDEDYLVEQALQPIDFLQAPAPLKNRALRNMLERAGRDVTQVRMQELEKQLRSPKFTKKLRGIQKQGLANAENCDTIDCDVLQSTRGRERVD
jgi:tRNA(Ile)-lysidine synthase